MKERDPFVVLFWGVGYLEKVANEALDRAVYLDVVWIVRLIARFAARDGGAHLVLIKLTVPEMFESETASVNELLNILLIGYEVVPYSRPTQVELWFRNEARIRSL